MKSFSILAISLSVAAFPVLTSGAAYAEDTAPVITNFKFGLICGAPNNRRICFTTDVIQVTNESRCIYNQTPIFCTWYGFSYDYTAASDTKIDCEFTTDKITNLGNPKELLKPATKLDVEIMLEKGQHHFFLAQYISGEKGDNSPRQAVKSCSFEGKPLFSTAYQFEFADPTVPVETVPDMNFKR